MAVRISDQRMVGSYNASCGKASEFFSKLGITGRSPEIFLGAKNVIMRLLIFHLYVASVTCFVHLYSQ